VALGRAESVTTVEGEVAAGEHAIELVRVRKEFGDVVAVDGVSLTIGAGEFFSLLGPSGSGKTTVLRMIAGFEQPSAGAILLAGKDVTHVAPYDRDVNTVFQDYALFPHMSVRQNVEYGLKVKGVGRAERRRRAGEMLDIVRLGQFGERRPNQLSGGQRQRVALARALVNQPGVLLLDEPLGALDLKLREEMQVELKRIQREVGITFVFVTHDQEEALTMSDRLAVMELGKVAQCGSPREVYEEPASAYVADFLGVANLLDVNCDGSAPSGGCHVRLGEATLRVTAGDLELRGPAKIVIRPEQVKLVDHGTTVENQLPGMVDRLVYLGPTTQLIVRLPGDVAIQTLVTNADARAQLTPGTPVQISLPPESVRLLPVPMLASADD
jgi:spermidine/putrescine ABC transporter ATP-binding subunit